MWPRSSDVLDTSRPAASAAESAGCLPRRDYRSLGLILCIGLVIRLAALPFAMSEDADAASRTWIAWRWLDHPHLITDGIWAPLHFYIIAVPLYLFADPLYPVIVLHSAIATAAAIFLYLFLVNEFEDEPAALATTTLFLFYPVYLRASLMATAEIPFVFFFLLALYLLSLARKPAGKWWHAVFAGAAMTLAGMLRYDAWLLMPFLAVALWRRPAFAAGFLATAAIFPASWMYGNWRAHQNPFYFISREAMDMADREDADTTRRLWLALFYPGTIFLGLTPVVAALAATGALICLARNTARAIWLVPGIGLLTIFSLKSGEAHLPLKSRYTISIGALFLCYAAEAFKLPAFARLRGRVKIALIASLALSMTAFSYADRFALPEAFHGVFRSSFNAIPKVKYSAEMQEIAAAVGRHLDSAKDAFICDYLGLSMTFFVALKTRLHPDRIFLAPGDRYPPYDPSHLSALTSRHQDGLLLLKSGSWFDGLLRNGSGDELKMAGHVLKADALDHFTVAGADITLYRYRVIRTVAADEPAGP
jgi:hypothetical protein